MSDLVICAHCGVIRERGFVLYMDGDLAINGCPNCESEDCEEYDDSDVIK